MPRTALSVERCSVSVAMIGDDRSASACLSPDGDIGRVGHAFGLHGVGGGC